MIDFDSLFQLESSFSAALITDTESIRDIEDEHLAVTDLAKRAASDKCLMASAGRLSAMTSSTSILGSRSNFGKQIDPMLLSTISSVSFLPAVSSNLAYGRPLHINSGRRGLYTVQLGWVNDRSPLLHEILARIWNHAINGTLLLGRAMRYGQASP